VRTGSRASGPPRASGRRGARPPAGRRQLGGVREIEAALRAGEPVRLVLVHRGATSPAARRVVERARRLGIRVRSATANDLRRMSHSALPGELLALVGPDPGADARTVLAAPGAAWLLVGIAYPGNAGFAIRTAEVSGAAGIFLDAGFGARGRKQALRAAMHAERFLPVLWASAGRVLDEAQAAGRRVLAIEDVGTRAPWEVDLTGAALFVIGGEERGIPLPVLERCDATLRIPMAGFVPSYNLQAAMAAVAVERLRQERSRPRVRRRAPR
jgi:tRNA G18 (ribose-2'-O)-methylase SpoU